MGSDLIIGAAIGGMWTAIVASAVISAMREDLGPARIERVFIDPETMEEWVGEKMWRATMAVISNLDRIKTRSWEVYDGR